MVEAEQRISKLENSYTLVAAELGQISKILSKMESSLEKQNEIMADIRLLRQAQEEDRRAKEETLKRIYKDIDIERTRIDEIDKAKSRVGWTIATMVMVALGSLVVKKGG